MSKEQLYEMKCILSYFVAFFIFMRMDKKPKNYVKMQFF